MQLNFRIIIHIYIVIIIAFFEYRWHKNWILNIEQRRISQNESGRLILRRNVTSTLSRNLNSQYRHSIYLIVCIYRRLTILDMDFQFFIIQLFSFYIHGKIRLSLIYKKNITISYFLIKILFYCNIQYSECICFSWWKQKLYSNKYPGIFYLISEIYFCFRNHINYFQKFDMINNNNI